MKNVLIISTLLILTACSNPLGSGDSIVDQGHHPGRGPDPTPVVDVVHSPGLDSSLVSSSQQLKATTRGYKVSQTVGELSSDLKSTTPRGYKFYSNIQGNLLSEEP